MPHDRIEKLIALETLKIFLEQHDFLNLHLGCGHTLLPNWLNIDLNHVADLKADLSKDLVFFDDSVDYIYSQHFLEHIELHEAIRLLRECYRVLKVGQVMRICIPDISVLLSIVTDENWQERRPEWTGKADFASPIELLNYGMYYICKHKYMYNYEELKRVALQAAPWTKIVKCEHGASDHYHLRNLETRLRKGNLIMEFVK